MCSIGRKIQHYRMLRNMSIKELAKGACDPSTLYRIESEKVIPELITIIQLCSNLKIPISHLIYAPIDSHQKQILRLKQKCRNYVFHQKYDLLSREIINLQNLLQATDDSRFNLFITWIEAILLYQHENKSQEAKQLLYSVLPDKPILEVEITMMTTLSSIYLDLNKNEKALSYSKQSYHQAKKLSYFEDLRSFVYISYGYATCLFRLGDLASAKEICTSIIVYLDEYHMMYKKSETLNLLRQAYEKTKQ